MKTFSNIWEEENTVVVRTQGKIERVEYPWYFVIKKDDATANRDFLIDLMNQRRVDTYEDEGNGWIRVYVPYLKRDFAITSIKQNMLTYEADLKLWQRYLIDNQLELEHNQSILYFDIETDDTKPGVMPGRDQIYSLAAIDNNGKEYFLYSVKNEKRLLKKIVELFSQYDIVAGWHSEGFDLPAITYRCELHRVPIDCWVSKWSSNNMGGLDNVRRAGLYRARPRFNHIDLMQKMKEMHYRDTELIKKVRSFSLSSVSQVFLGDDKVDLGSESIKWLAHNDKEKLREYNLQDVRLCKALDEKLSIVKQKIIEHAVCGARLNDYTSSGRIDPFALRFAHKQGVHLLSRPDHQKSEDDNVVEKDYEGGFVFEPVRGKHKDVYIFDFQSLYPSIIKTFNVSIDSYKGMAVPGDDVIMLPTGVAFSKTERGIIPSIIQYVLDQRNQIRFGEMKKVEKESPEWWNLHYKQYSFKVLANSMYGIMGASFSRYYKRELAEGITLTGQYIIKYVHQWLVNEGHDVIYGDTDSLFLKLNSNEPPEEISKRASKDLGDHLIEKFGVTENHMSFDFEAKYDDFLMISKKKYVGRKYDGSMKISGLEFKKRDTLPFAEQWQKALVDLLLEKDESVEFYIDWVMKHKEIMYSGKIDTNLLVFQKKLSREIDDYGKVSKKTGRSSPVPVHVRIAKQIREKMENVPSGGEKMNMYSQGSYIPYIVTSSKKGIQAVHTDDFDGTYDADYYWDKSFDPSKRILEAIFPEVNWDKLGEDKQQKLL